MAKKKHSGTDLAARFNKLTEEIKTESEKELVSIADIVKNEAKALAPKNTGALSASIATRLKYNDNSPAAVIGTIAPYATYVEFAEDINGHPYMPDVETPRFLYKALGKKRAEIRDKIVDAINKGIDKCVITAGDA